MAEIKDVLTALGIAEDADPVAVIAELKATIKRQETTIASDKKTAESDQLAQMQADLTEARGKLMIEQTENAREIASIRAEARKDKVIATVEKAIASGVRPVMRDELVKYGMDVTAERFEDFIRTIPRIDLTERGVASGSELAELEPTQAEVAIAKNMGTDVTSKDWRLGIMREKAKARGLTLPAEVG